MIKEASKVTKVHQRTIYIDLIFKCNPNTENIRNFKFGTK